MSLKAIALGSSISILEDHAVIPDNHDLPCIHPKGNGKNGGLL
jgi:hypothetical protein